MNKCDEMFHETFPNTVWRDDTAITVWRECWKVCTERMIYQITHRNQLFTDGMRREYEDNKQTRATTDVSERAESVNLHQGKGRSVGNRASATATARAITEETLGRIRGRRN